MHSNGDRIMWENGLQAHIVEYYTSIFKTAQNLDLSIVDDIQGHLSSEQNEALYAQITKKEV